jgi:hypothetical protein
VAPRSQRKGATRQAILVDLPDNTGSTTAETQEEEQPKTAADEQISNAIEAEAQGAEAMVYRSDPSTGKEAFLDRISAEVVTQDWIGKEYGGGKYRVQFRKPGPNGGAFVYGGQKRFEVDPAIPSKPPRWARLPASGEVKNADGSPAGGASGMDAVLSSGILSLFQQQQENSRMQADWFRSMMEQRSKAPGIVEIMVAAAPILTIVKELLQRPAAAPVVPGKDPIELAKELLELSGGRPTTEAKGAVQQLKEVLELRELLSGLGGGADAEDPMIKLVGMLGPQIIDAIKNAQTIDAQRTGAPATTSRPTALPSTPARATVATAPGSDEAPRKAASEPAPAQTQTTGEQSPMDMVQAYIGARLGKIVKLAVAGKNPDLYAQLEEDILPEGFKDAARAFVSQDDFVEQIFTAYPQLNEHREWFEDFFDTFRAALMGELEEDFDDEEDRGEEEDGRTTDSPDVDGGPARSEDQVVRADIQPETTIQPGSRNGTVE